MAAPASDGIRVRVCAAILLDGRLVLVRHRAGHARYHLLPGGGVERGETLEQALLREVREETGLNVSVGRLLFVNDSIDPSGRRHMVSITFEAQVTGGSLTLRQKDDQIEDVDLVEPSSLEDLDLRPPMATQLQAALDGSPLQQTYLGSLWRNA